MLRLLPALAIAAMLASAFFLYGVKYETRRLELEVQAKEREAERARSDIAVLKAERAFLGRPERIEPLARAQGLRPPVPSQYVRADRASSAAAPATEPAPPALAKTQSGG